jgi:acyl carrier protein
MERQETLKILKDLLKAEFFGGDPIELDASTPLLRQGILDSFSLLQLTVRLEETFGVPINVENLRLEQFEDLNAICDLVESMRGQT